MATGTSPQKVTAAKDDWVDLPAEDEWADLSPEAAAAKAGSGPANLMNWLARQTVQSAPKVIGAVGGGILGAPLGPAGIAAGGGLGAGMGQTLTNVFNQMAGNPAPRNFPEAMRSVGGATVEGMLQEGPVALAAKMNPGAAAARPLEQAGLVKPSMTRGQARDIVAAGPARIKNAQEDLAAAYIAPVDEQIARLQLEKSRLQQALAEQSAYKSAQSEANLMALRAARNSSLEAAKQSATTQAKAVSQQIGTQTNTSAISQGAKKAWEAGRQAFDNAITVSYNKIRAIAAKPENATVINETTEEGVKIPKTYNGLVDFSKLKPELAEEYARIQAEMKIAAKADSPGAKALVEFFEGNPMSDVGRTIDNLRAINKLSKYDKQFTFSDNSIRLARRVGHYMSKGLDEGIGNLAGDDAVTATAELARAKELLANRTAMFRNPEYATAARAIPRYGSVLRLKDDPRAFSAWWDSLDPAIVSAKSMTPLDPEAVASMAATRSGAKRQLADWLTQNDYKSFSTRWRQLNPEVKAKILAPEEVARLEAVSQGNTKAVTDLVRDYEKKIGDEALAAVMNRRDIALKRAKLAEMTRDTLQKRALKRELEQKVAREIERYTTELKEAEDKLMGANKNVAAAKRSAFWFVTGAAGAYGAYRIANLNRAIINLFMER